MKSNCILVSGLRWLLVKKRLLLGASLTRFYKKLENVSCEYDRLNGWNSTLQAAWYIRHVRIIWFLWTKRTIRLLILSFTQNIVRACSMFYPYGGYRSVTPLDAARVNRTIVHDHSVHWNYITLVECRGIKKGTQDSLLSWRTASLLLVRLLFCIKTSHMRTEGCRASLSCRVNRWGHDSRNPALLASFRHFFH